MLKTFPLKDFSLKICMTFVVIFSFKIIESYINQKNLTIFNNSDSKNTLFNSNIQRYQSRNLHQKKLTPQKEIDTYQLVQKFDAHIEEQAHLLSNIEITNNNPNLDKQLCKIKLTLERIRLEASKRNIQDLIDHPLISEIENKLISYKQSLAFN